MASIRHALCYLTKQIEQDIFCCIGYVYIWSDFVTIQAKYPTSRVSQFHKDLFSSNIWRGWLLPWWILLLLRAWYVPNGWWRCYSIQYYNICLQFLQLYIHGCRIYSYLYVSIFLEFKLDIAYTPTCVDCGCRKQRHHKKIQARNAAEMESQKLKRKIFFILATDFICWVPICVFGIVHTILIHVTDREEYCKYNFIIPDGIEKVDGIDVNLLQ